jgi:hypothetical protein
MTMSTAQNTQLRSAYYCRMHIIKKYIRDISVQKFVADSINNNHKYAWGTVQHHREIHTHTALLCTLPFSCYQSSTEFPQIFYYSTFVVPRYQTPYYTIGSLTIHKIRRGLSIYLEVFLLINDLVHLVSSGTVRGHNWVIMTI